MVWALWIPVMSAGLAVIAAMLLAHLNAEALRRDSPMILSLFKSRNRSQPIRF